MEIVIVRLISSGTSASVTAYPVYFSGGSVIINGVEGIARFTDAFSGHQADVFACDPVSADFTAVRCVNVRAFAVGADIQFLEWCSLMTMPLEESPRHFKD